MNPLPIVLAAAFLAGACAGGLNPPRSPTGAAEAADVERTFLALDTDRSGELSRGEAAQSPSLARGFERADANDNGLLDRFEFNSPAWRAFEDEPD